MHSKQARSIVSEELEQIPRGAEGSLQQNFRLAYSQMRYWTLMEDWRAPRSAAFGRAAQMIREDQPDFQPELFDPAYFGWRG